MYQMEPFVAPVEVPESLPIMQEIGVILADLALGDALRERAMFRLWRIYVNHSFTEIASEESGSMLPKYPTWTVFLEDFCAAAGVSRATIYARVKTYSELAWLGYSEDEMLEMMSKKPGLYERVLNRLLSWDTASNEPVELKTDRLGEFDDIEEAREPIVDLLGELNGHQRINDALSYVDHSVLGRPFVSLSVRNGVIVLNYSENDITSVDGGTEGTEEIVFSPDADAPLWVYDEIKRRYNVRIVIDEDYIQ